MSDNTKYAFNKYYKMKKKSCVQEFCQSFPYKTIFEIVNMFEYPLVDFTLIQLQSPTSNTKSAQNISILQANVEMYSGLLLYVNMIEESMIIGNLKDILKHVK